jgi:hypothetical protein
MKLEISQEQAREILTLLDDTLREMSHEIAATENPTYRSGLIARRQLLSEVERAMRASVVASAHLDPPDGEVLVRQMARPGD